MTDLKDNGFSITNTPVFFPEVKNPGNDPDWPCSAYKCWEEPYLQMYGFFSFKEMKNYIKDRVLAFVS